MAPSSIKKKNKSSLRDLPRLTKVAQGILCNLLLCFPRVTFFQCLSFHCSCINLWREVLEECSGVLLCKLFSCSCTRGLSVWAAVEHPCLCVSSHLPLETTSGSNWGTHHPFQFHVPSGKYCGIQSLSYTKKVSVNFFFPLFKKWYVGNIPLKITPHFLYCQNASVLQLYRRNGQGLLHDASLLFLL